MKKRPILKTKELLLRPFKLTDAKVVKKLANDKAIVDTTLNIPYPYKVKHAREWISTHQPKFQKGELINYAVTLKDRGSLIGVVDLRVKKQFNHAELGYWIGKDFWGNGYCTQAARALIEYGFNKFNLHKIFAHHFTRNPASGKVMRKVGMKKEGLLKEHVKKWDKYEDIVFYSILKKEWNK